MSTEDDDYAQYDSYPYVCPGCFAVEGETCSLDCSELRRERDEEHERQDEDALELCFSPVWPPTHQGVAELLFGSSGSDDDEEELVPESCRTEPLQEAAAELAMATRRLDQSNERLYQSLRPNERALLQKRFRPRRERRSEASVRDRQQVLAEGGSRPGDGFPLFHLVDLARLDEGARSCRWCHELVEDDFSHDFCEPEEPTEKMPRPELPVVRGPDRWREQLCCPNCRRVRTIELVAPPQAVERNIPTAITCPCPCGVAISLAYSWRKQKVVALRYQRPDPLSLVADREKPN